MRVPALSLAAAALLLSGCGRSQETTAAAPAAPPPAAPAPVDFARPLNALGNDPFWAIKIRPEGILFSAPAGQEVSAPNGGPKLEAEQATWTASGSDGRPLVAVLRAAVCQDGVSGLSYPFTATVQSGGRTLKGCAAYADAMPRQGG
jgi:uncharacterized membrane protein